MISQCYTEDVLIEAVRLLGWNVVKDDIVVEIGGVASSGIHQSEDANPKWAKPFGSTTYQQDAFIVIKNRSRSPIVTSKPNPELKAYHEST